VIRCASAQGHYDNPTLANELILTGWAELSLILALRRKCHMPIATFRVAFSSRFFSAASLPVNSLSSSGSEYE
jgi:hypothetical protein